MESIAVFVVVTLAAANIAAATKRAEAPVKNTIQCSAFKKMPDGTWYVEGPTTFRIGTFKKTTFTQQSIGPDFFTFGGADLYKVIRQSAIPYHDDMVKREYTPLQCVNRVLSVEILAAAPENERLPIRVDLEVNGIGSWRNDIAIVMPSKATLEKIRERQKNAIPLR